MTVHFIGSRSQILEEILYYRQIIAIIRKSGNKLAQEWVEEVYRLAQQGQLKNEEETWNEVDKSNADAVFNADIVIVEGTAKSFFAGYQVAQAVAQKKPILILTRDNSPVGISGLSTPTGFIKSVTYNEKSIGSILEDFLSENTIDTRDLRFNFFLDRQTYGYLRWEAARTGKTKAEIIRSLLVRAMNRK